MLAIRQAFDLTAMAAGDLANQRQAKAYTACLLRSARQPVERFENPLALSRRHARPAVAYFQHGAAAGAGQHHAHLSLTAMPARVFQKVAYHATQ